MQKYIAIIIFCLAGLSSVSAQETETVYMNYSTPRSYEIGGITVMGASALDPRSIIQLSGLEIGMKITLPGEKIGTAIEQLWKQGIFGNIDIYATSIQENKVFLVIEMEELPRMSKMEITGIRTFEASKLREELGLKPDDVITDNRLNRLRIRAIDYYRNKGFFNTKVDVYKKHDTLTSGVNVTFDVKTGPRVKIKSIEINGNEAIRKDDPNESFHGIKQFWRKMFVGDLAFSDAKIRRTLKETKQKNIFRFWKRSKYVDPSFRDDLKNLEKAYNTMGFRDMRVVKDSLIVMDEKSLKLVINLQEGNPYYFGNIDFVGNTKHSDEELAFYLDLKKGDIFNDEKLQTNLFANMQQGDIQSLYMDEGYLSFTAIPVETRVNNDTVDLEIRIREGKQAHIKGVSVKGNERTNDHVILRELRVYPGQLFSRTDIINSLTEMRMMRYFNDETINPQVIGPDANGDVNIEFQVEEIGTDQVELSGGWGAGQIVGTLGFTFNNFSIQNLFRKDRWRPLPSGDGQKLSIRGQSNGSVYYSVSASYTEPWLGGKKPYSFSVTAYTSMQSNGVARTHEGRGQLTTNGVSIGLGQRLRVPDRHFTLYQSLNYQRYNAFNFSNYFRIADGKYNNISYTASLSRQAIDNAIFPKTGSEFSISMQMTPPYSLLNGKKDADYANMLDQEQFKWLEFYKWSFRASLFMNPVANLVFNARMRFGSIGRYNKNMGITPFERYKLGGDGMSGYSYAGEEIVGMRGYINESLSPETGAAAFNKLTFEARYPITTNPAATIYVLAFVEAGNSWENPRKINPFKNYRSAGVGVRLFLAAMGMFGLDWGYGFDDVPGIPDANKGQVHFSINQSLD